MSDDVPPPRKPRKKAANGDRRGGDRVTPGAREETARRTARVVQLRLAGLTYEQIAAQTGYTDRTGPAAAFSRALADVVRVPAREALETELARLDALQVGIWARAISGNIAAQEQALRIMAHRAKLLGLNGAVKIDVTTESAQADVRSALAELLSLIDHQG